ncbi:hypothetical protein BU23DRAFT_15677 [Bimuria novae-zelandiae CBS 107.79]|uniref:Uncharacterized protein n=1 Tax=Bimuria novae-zelandiae CBS 107.79 TaxID=1447943 RepID=A0A6A5VMJ3_9PLEO|nr:hypothetical protein BU23DRAFT_15677 [Bimuria novae-zelandiae CBS 107.79]
MTRTNSDSITPYPAFVFARRPAGFLNTCLSLGSSTRHIRPLRGIPTTLWNPRNLAQRKSTRFHSLQRQAPKATPAIQRHPLELFLKLLRAWTTQLPETQYILHSSEPSTHSTHTDTCSYSRSFRPSNDGCTSTSRTLEIYRQCRRSPRAHLREDRPSPKLPEVGPQ